MSVSLGKSITRGSGLAIGSGVGNSGVNGRSGTQIVIFDASTGNLSNLVYSGGGDRVYHNSAGALVNSSSEIIRVGYIYNGASWVLSGVLREVSRKNDVIHGRKLDEWSLVDGATVAADAVDAYGAANGAWTVEDDSASALELIRKNFTIPDDSNPNSFYIRLKKDSVETRFPEFQMTMQGGTAISVNAQINTATGAFTIRTGTPTDSGVIDEGDWWRLWFSESNNGSGNTTLFLRLYPAVGTTLGGISVAAVGTVISDVMGHEENAPYLTTDIPTAAAAVTAPAENISVDPSFFYTDEEGVLSFVGMVNKAASGASQTLCEIHDGSSNNLIRLTMNATGFVNVLINSGGATVANLTDTTEISDRTEFTARVRSATDNFALQTDENEPKTDTGGAIPTGLNDMEIGEDQSGGNEASLAALRATWDSKGSLFSGDPLFF